MCTVCSRSRLTHCAPSPLTAPQTQFYNNLGQECVQVGCSVSLFLLNNTYVDLATIGQVVRLTGGEIFKYTYFQVRERELTRACR